MREEHGLRTRRMVAMQAEGCAPIVRAFTAGEEFASRWENAATVAVLFNTGSGLKYPGT